MGSTNTMKKADKHMARGWLGIETGATHTSVLQTDAAGTILHRLLKHQVDR